MMDLIYFSGKRYKNTLGDQCKTCAHCAGGTEKVCEYLHDTGHSLLNVCGGIEAVRIGRLTNTCKGYEKKTRRRPIKNANSKNFR